MKKFFASIVFIAVCFLAALPLVSCTGQFDLGFNVSGIVPPTAAQEFEATGGNTVHITDMDAVNSVTVTTTRDANNNVIFPLACGNNMTWTVQGLDPVNYDYWIAKTIVVTFDANKFLCGQTWRCDRPRDANGYLPGNVVLEDGFGARVNVVCELVP